MSVRVAHQRVGICRKHEWFWPMDKPGERCPDEHHVDEDDERCPVDEYVLVDPAREGPSNPGSEGLAERLEGTEPLTDEEIQAAVQALEAALDAADGEEGPFPAWEGARAKLRARLAREDAPDEV